MAGTAKTGRRDEGARPDTQASHDATTDFNPSAVRRAISESTRQEQSHDTRALLADAPSSPSAEERPQAARGTLDMPSQAPQDRRGVLDEGNGGIGSDTLSDDGGTSSPSSKKAKGHGAVPKKLLMLLLPILLPGLILLLCVLMLLQSITSMHSGTSSSSADGSSSSASAAASTSAGTNAVTRRTNNMTLPSVNIDGDFSFLADEEDEEDKEDEEDEEIPADCPPYIATFFAGDYDWTNTLYGSDDCSTFREIGTVPNEARDPCIMLYKGRFWVITCRSDQNGVVELVVSSSKDLKSWSNPVITGQYTLDRLPAWAFDGGHYDVVAPEWFRAPDDSIHVIFSCGFWGSTHGDNWNDHMESYMLDVSTLTMENDVCKMEATGPAKWMSVNSDGADRIDGNIVYTNNRYYLTIKRNGLNMELWENSSLSASGWSIIHDCSLYGYEAPCVIQAEGTWRIFADGVPDIHEFGTCMWSSNSIDGEWSQQNVSFYYKDGSQVPSDHIRHGTVLPVKGAKSKGGGSGSSQKDGSLNATQKAVIKACKEVPSPGQGLCAAWVGDVYEKANVGVSFRGDARDWYHECCKSGSPYNGGTVKTDSSYSTLKPGMVIAVPSSSSGSSAGKTYGHIGIYIGDGKVMHNIGSIATCSVQSWIDTYGQYADTGWGWPPGIKQ